jgi:hypothetical protein
VNIGLVGDTGPAFGTGGATQGDPRFGDIRVGGRSLAPDVLAVTAPYALYDNYSGDVVVNTAAGFAPGGSGGGYDLFTALLQEAGHSLGVGNSSDPASVMYEYYLGARSDLSAGDVASIQALYGPRVPDRYEGSGGNNTLGTATSYTSPVDAELTTAADVDVYKFTTGLLTNQITVNLTAAGLSLLTAKVDLLDANGNVVATTQSTDPTANDLTASFGSVRALSTYYVRVSAARTDVFGVGAYHLEVQQSSPLSPVATPVVTLLNNSLATATTLIAAGSGVGPQTEYHATGRFGSASDVDYYRFTVPFSGPTTPVTLLTTVWGKNGAALSPWVEVQDVNGGSLVGEVITADGGTTTIQVRGLLPGETYFLKLTSDTHSVGDYVLAGDLRVTPFAFPDGGSGTLGPSHPEAAATITLPQTDQVHLVLSTTGPAGSAAELVVTAPDGTVFADLPVATGRGRSVDLFLPAGTYRVVIRLAAGTAPVGWVLGASLVTDPVGARADDTGSSPDGTSTTTSTSTDSSGGGTGGSGSSDPSSTSTDTSGQTSTTDTTTPWWQPEDDADSAVWY